MEQCRASFLCGDTESGNTTTTKKKRGGGEGAESNSPASHASERVREGQENKLKKREKKGLTREKKKVEMQVTQKQRAGGGKSNRQVLIFLQR